jgi:hypothetical protein
MRHGVAQGADPLRGRHVVRGLAPGPNSCDHLSETWSKAKADPLLKQPDKIRQEDCNVQIPHHLKKLTGNGPAIQIPNSALRNRRKVGLKVDL